MKICAIIPIKHVSQRVPGKNYRLMNGKPLYHYILDTVLKCKYISHIIIDTNSDIIKEGIQEHYDCQKISVYDRPVDLQPGDTPVNKLLINVIKSLNLQYDFYLQTHTTNPLLSVKTLNQVIETFYQKINNGYDSLFTVKTLQTRLYKLGENKNVVALNHDINELLPTQDLEPLYEENSCIYIFTSNVLIKKKHRIGYNPYMFIMNDIESQDIDTEFDFKTTELLQGLSTDNIKKIVLITGVNGGIGTEIAKKFKKMGYYVVGTSRSKNLQKYFIDRYIQSDLTEENSVKHIIQSIEKNEKRIDCIVHNAAVQICKPIWEQTEKEWDLTFDCNLKTIYRFVKHGINLLKKSKGNIINIGSVHSVNTSDKIAAYACTKAAISGLTRNLSIELGQFGIRVNTVSPGAVDTNMLRDGLLRGHVSGSNSDELVESLGQKHILKRVGKPCEIADLIWHVNTNQFLTGSNIIIDGGATIKLSTE